MCQFFINNFTLLLLGCSLKASTYIKAEGSSQTIVKVSQYGRDVPNCWNNNSVPCGSLLFAMKKPSLNFTTVILSSGVHTLNETISVKYTKGLVLKGSLIQETSTVRCEGNNSGLSFENCHHLTVSGLQLDNCGAEHPSTSRINGTTLPLFTSIFLKNCFVVTLSGMEISNSWGMGAVFYDVCGKVSLTDFNVDNSKSHQGSIIKGTSSGGGLYIEFTNDKNRLTSIFNTNCIYTLSSCAFKHNTAERFYSYPSPENDTNTYVSFGRGGAVSLMSKGTAINNSFLFKHCHFENNTALWGAGIFTEFHSRSGNNSVKVEDSSFVSNKATYGGGGIRVGLASDHSFGVNLVRLKNCTFRDNSGEIGGAFSQYRETKAAITKEVTIFDNCTFAKNRAFLGAGIHMSVSQFELHRSVLSDNFVINHLEETSGKGALYLFSSVGILKHFNEFVNNSWTALVLEFSSVELFDKVKFIRNVGIKGGAIAAYGDSFIKLREKSHIVFYENTALRLGGALYVKTPGPPMAPMDSTEFLVYKCAVLFGDEEQHPQTFDTQIEFINNTASTASGSAVFMSTLNWCRQYGEPKYNNTAMQWRNFYYMSKDLEPPIMTNPVVMEVHESDWDRPPAMGFKPRVVLRDELWNSTSGTVKVMISSFDPSVKLAGSNVFAIKDELPRISIYGREQSLFNVTIETVVGVSIRTKIVNRKLSICQRGYFQSPGDSICKCLSTQGLEKGVMHCQAEKVFTLRGRWGNPKGPNENFAKHHCPRSYCEKCKDATGKASDVECIYDKHKQCAKNRKWDSVLCGSCKEGYSVLLGNEDCEKCSNYYLFLLLLWIFLLTVFVLVIMRLNLESYFTYLNAYLYSYQVLPLVLVGNLKLDKFISFVMGLTNFSGTGGNFGICLWNGLTDLQKLALNYITPTYILAFTGFICYLTLHWRKCPFKNNSALRALALLSIFVYADFTRITFELLHYIEVDGVAVLYLQGDVKFFGKEHAFYAFLALVVLVVVVLLLPLGLIFFPLLTKCWVKSQGIIDSFQEPFKKGYERFASFYLICRCIVFAIFVFSDAGVVRDTLLAIACQAILIIFLIVKPYKEKNMNYFDTLLLGNISFVATINVALNVITERKNRVGLQIISAVLTYLPFICIFVQFLRWLYIVICRSTQDNANGQNNKNNGREFRNPQRVYEDEEGSGQRVLSEIAETYRGNSTSYLAKKAVEMHRTLSGTKPLVAPYP
eukprot:gene4668-20952_t